MTSPAGSGELTIDGKRLETVWLAPRSLEKPAIVMLHEGLGSIALWKNFPERLAERTGCGVLVYSRYGHGGSDPLAEKRDVHYLHREGEVALPALLEQTGIVKPVLLGHSDGASIAIIYAGRYPAQPRALILEAPHVFVEDVTVRGVAQARVAYQDGDLRRRLARYHSHVDDTFWGWSDIWLDPRFRSWNIESYLSSIRCPVLLIQGEGDEYASTRQLDAIRGGVPAAETLLLDGGHTPHRDHPEAVLERIAAFIDSLSN